MDGFCAGLASIHSPGACVYLLWQIFCFSSAHPFCPMFAVKTKQKVQSVRTSRVADVGENIPGWPLITEWAGRGSDGCVWMFGYSTGTNVNNTCAKYNHCNVEIRFKEGLSECCLVFFMFWSAFFFLIMVLSQAKALSQLFFLHHHSFILKAPCIVLLVLNCCFIEHYIWTLFLSLQ